MGRSVIVSKVLATASANNICTSQTPSGAGFLTLNGSTVSGGVATLDTARRVLFTSGTDNSARTLTVIGTNETGNVITETLTAPATTGATVNDYKTVISIAISGAAAGTLTAGTNTTGSTPWKNANTWQAPFALEIDSTVTGTVTYSIETTNSDFLAAVPVVLTQTTSVAASNATAKLALTSPVRAWRLSITAGAGSVISEAFQAG